MLSNKKHSPQLGLFHGLGDQLDQTHPLFRLADKINWQTFEDAFKVHYSEKMGKPAKPIRLMVSLLILKYVRNLSDEAVVAQWAENIYFQYFGGEQHFQACIPCVPTELVAFRQRVSEPGMELILKESIRVNEPPGGGSGIVSVDTTVQEKNITYPTDDKLYKKIIRKCWGIAEKEGLALRQSYKRTVPRLSALQRFKNTRKGAKAARKAGMKIKTIARRLVYDVARKLLAAGKFAPYQPDLKIYRRVLLQQRGDSGKVYSLHEPDVKCYSKGKEHKRFEFGSKASFVVDQQTGIIMGALNFTQPLHDSKTLPEVLEQYERLNSKEASEVFVDRGYKGKSEYKASKIYVPRPDKNISKQRRNGHSRRAAIEPVIGHLKKDYRLCRNYLKGILGDNMNVILAAAAMNFKRVMNLWLTGAINRWLLICRIIAGHYWAFVAQNAKPTF